MYLTTKGPNDQNKPAIKIINIAELFLSFCVLDKSTPVSGSSSIPSGVISFGKGVKVDSGLSSYFLLVSLNTPNKLIIKRKKSR